MRGNKKIALIGEAAGFISPSSAEGLSYAFKSALDLANALEEGLEDYELKYKDNTANLINNIFLKNIKSKAMYNIFLRSIIMRSGLMSIDMNPNLF
ncbi:Rossmann-fold NAD(P)-binding domain-containing protein [Anaerocellum danielii]|uniref:FAD-binding domain-containing protein n=1 Tax=Anaerocellum danielii TaxID=1387557 RepID=A0ABZ0U345_9FIRM|nr:hypothetical protein [Caldicellulosiruptor danielii]WPX08879.1 hypothetical protein SOJ16_000036 [Caldicellulosiruptor danielii]